MGKITIAELQEYADRFRSDIISNMHIDIEEIRVEESTVPLHGMNSPQKGVIYVNLKEYDPDKTSPEVDILHELGHRTKGVVAPNSDLGDLLDRIVRDEFEEIKSMRGTLTYYLRIALDWIRDVLPIWRDSAVPLFIEEGAAEFFALDIFQDFCNLSYQSRLHIEKRKASYKKHTSWHPYAPYSQGYLFFHAIYERSDLKRVLEYLSGIGNLYPIPKLRDIVQPDMYFEKFLESRSSHS